MAENTTVGLERLFNALADPTRIKIFEMLANAQTALSITAISDQFVISRQAVTKHVGILFDANLVKFEYQGRERFCFINKEPLKDIEQWCTNYADNSDSHQAILEKFIGRQE